MKDYYIKSRRIYVSIAGLMFSWEYLNIRISKLPILGLDLSQEDMMKVPYILSTVLLYLAYRVTNDWFYMAPSKLAARIDLVIVHIIGFTTLLSVFIPNIWADNPINIDTIILGMALFFCLFGVIVTFNKDFKVHMKKDVLMTRIGMIIVFMSVLNIAYSTLIDNLQQVVIIVILYGAFLLILFLIFKIPGFIMNSDEGKIVNRIQKAFDAEEELKKTVIKIDDVKE